MLQEIFDIFYWLIGIDQRIADLSVLQVITRTTIVYGTALLVIRLGKRRFLGGYTAFDILLGFVIGSILSRTITGREHFWSSFIAIITLLAIHYIIAYLTFYFNNASKLLKNDKHQLIKDGEMDVDAMEASKIGENDLLQALRQRGGVESPEDVEAAYLERDGAITVIPKKSEPKVLEVEVENGVQTVRIVLS